jgi:molybdenum cofactor synthesis domain-containing protein
MMTDKKAGFDLLEKTELKIDNIILKNANLTDIALETAHVLKLNPDEVLVVDYSNDALTLDILNSCINAYNIVGKKDILLNRLQELPGVFTSDKTQFTSNGMLGWIALEEGPAKDALAKSQKMVAEIEKNLSKRGIVFSSGAEVAEKKIEDTNRPTIMNHFESVGYTMTRGETLRDDTIHITAKLREAAEMGGYGIIITTGGVGAEDKDHTVEAVKAIDPTAATPYICHFTIGTGRHVKDGVKIAVGEYNGTFIIALPGPNDEVKASLDPMIQGFKAGSSKQDLAEMIAVNLRQILRRKMQHGKGGLLHEGCQLHRTN